MKIGKYWIHRLEQCDLGCKPIICIHEKAPNKSERVFCLGFLKINYTYLDKRTKKIASLRKQIERLEILKF